jgi:(1->4)-alpha-D-glucan 1-alpha-D-glucosylmutase
VAYVRGGSVVTVAPTRALHVLRSGWGDDAVELPEGRWTDVFTGAVRDGGRIGLADLLADFPVAVLLRS